METTNTQAKQGLFSALASHEVGQAEANTIESNQGLRPRLPNRYEALDAKVEIPSFEEQQLETSIPASKPGFSEEPSETAGLRAVKPSVPQENLFQSKERFDYRTTSLEPAHAIGQRNDRIPEAEPQFRGIWTEGHEVKLASGITGFKPPVQDSLQQSSASKVPQEKSITEKLTTVERETLREINSLKPSMPKSGQQTGLIPKMQPVQALMSPAVEKSSQPNIEIHIGRIEVRANIQATQPKPEKMPSSSTNDVALQVYLQSRSRGARS